jgi:hypothetical protein
VDPPRTILLALSYGFKKIQLLAGWILERILSDGGSSPDSVLSQNVACFSGLEIHMHNKV